MTAGPLPGTLEPCCLRVCSRWNCQWESASYWREEWTNSTGDKEVKWSRRCAPIIQSFGMAAATIWKIDNAVPVFVNGLGQNRNYEKDTSGSDYHAMSWGDGFISVNQHWSRRRTSQTQACS